MYNCSRPFSFSMHKNNILISKLSCRAHVFGVVFRQKLDVVLERPFKARSMSTCPPIILTLDLSTRPNQDASRHALRCHDDPTGGAATSGTFKLWISNQINHGGKRGAGGPSCRPPNCPHYRPPLQGVKMGQQYGGSLSLHAIKNCFPLSLTQPTIRGVDTKGPV